MLTFLLFYLAIYGGAHAYLVSRSVRSFHLAAPYPAIFALVSAFMVLAPVLVRMLERYEMESTARVVGYIGYLWMGFFFLYLSASVALDILRGLAALAGWLLHRPVHVADAHLLAVAMVIAAVASVYGLFEAQEINVERVTLRTPKLPQSSGPLRIVQISDVHLGLMVGKGRLDKILAEVAALKPDLLVSTGDLVDGQKDGLKTLDRELAQVQAPLGKYAVLGNHEVYAGVAPSTSFTEQSGFKLLRGEAQAVTPFVTVAGVDDPAIRHEEKGAEQRLLSALPRERYTILLKHRPKVEESSEGLFDLQLSGHVHKGQLFPFNLITHLAYPVKMGLSDAGRGSFLYVSRGTGTWGPPLRVLAPPEVTVIDVLPAS